MKKVEIVLKGTLSVLMIFFGLNKFAGFLEVAPPEGQEAQLFLGAMFTTFLVKVVAFFEVVGGVLLLSPKTAFMGWLFLAPVFFNIVAFHIAHDFVGNGVWILPTLLFAALGLFYQHKITSLLIN